MKRIQRAVGEIIRGIGVGESLAYDMAEPRKATMDVAA